jgi:hypothetical protein
MPRVPGSVRSLGRDNIQLDRPTKLRLKQQAADAGKTLVEYLRDIANSGPDIQADMLRGNSNSISGIRKDIVAMGQQINAIASTLPMTDKRLLAVNSMIERHIKFMDARHQSMLLEHLQAELEAYLAKEGTPELRLAFNE